MAGAAQHHPLCPTHVHTCVLSMCVCPPHRPTGHIRVSRTQTRVPRQAHARARHMCAEVSYTLPRANAHVCTQVGRYPPPPCKHTRAHVCAGIATQCAETPTCLQVSHSHVQTHTHVCMRVTLPCANTHMCHAPVCKHVHTRARHHTPSGSNRLLAKQHPRAPRPPSNGGGAVPGHPHPSPRTPDPSSPSLHPTES